MVDDAYSGTERRKWTLSDHDILIEIRTTVRRMEAEISSDRKGIWQQIGIHQERLRLLEDMMNRLQPEKAHSRYDTMLAEWADFKSRQRAYLGIAGAVGGTIMWVLQFVLSRVIGQVL